MSFFIVPVSAETDIYYPDPYSYTCYNYFFNNGYNHLRLTSNNNTTYYVNLDQTGSITGSESGNEHTTGTINSNGSSTLGSKYMTCTTNNGTSASQTYSCYFSNRSNSVSNSQSINIGFNENTYTNVDNTISLKPNTDITGSITTSGSDTDYTYLPWIYGNYTSNTSGYDSNKRVWIDSSSNRIFMIFYTNSRITNNNDNTGVYIDPAISGSVKWKYNFLDTPLSGMYLNIFELIWLEGAGNVSFKFYNLSNQAVLPLYYGPSASMPDDVAIMAGLRKTTNTLLQYGDDNTSSSVSNADNAKNQVSNKISNFDNIESNSISDMNSNIQNLDITSDILENSKFLSSANWVKVQFDRMTVNTPIGSVLSFSLILGITLIFLGKIR